MNVIKFYIIFSVLTAFAVYPVAGQPPAEQNSGPLKSANRQESTRIWLYHGQTFSEPFLLMQLIDPDNKPPKADAGKNQKLQDADNNGQEAVQLDGSGSTDKDGEIVSYSWIREGGEIASGVRPTVNLPTGNHTVELKVTDDENKEGTDMVKIKIDKGADDGDGDNDDGDGDGDDENDGEGGDNGDGDGDNDGEDGDGDDDNDGDDEEEENKEPKAEAGDDQELTDTGYDGQETVQLDGSKSKDKDGEIVSYSWSLNGEEKVTGETAEITLPIGEHTIKLTVTDDGDLSDTDEMQVRIKEGPNRAPVADAGPDQSLTDVDRLGELEVQLDGSGSTDPDGTETIKSYSWTQGGTEIATGIDPIVTLPVGSQVIGLTVTDEEGLTDTDEVNILISSAPNEPPVADAGPDQSLTDVNRQGQLEVQLDGSGSMDSDGNIQSYSWVLEGAEIATGINPVVPLSVGSHLIVLTVTDEEGLTDTDEANIIISGAANEPPVANAGADQELTDADLDGLEVVSFNGSGSTDPDENIQTYSWSVNGEEIATGVNATAELAIGTTTVVLTVSDEEGLSDSDEVVISILEGEDDGGGGEEPENSAPVANAGADQELIDANKDGQENVVLDASASADEDGNISSYSWSIGGTEVATGVNPNIMLGIGSHSVLLTVTDNEGKTATDEVLINIKEEGDSGGEEEEEEVRNAFIPNLFSPNGDQMNDRLLVHASGIASLHWRIYNRRGVLVFETKEVVEATEMGWDGSTGGEPLPEGSYVWILEASFQDGTPVLVDGEIKGSVTLIR